MLEHATKVVEGVFENRIRQQVKVDDMQFGYMPGKGTTNAVFVVIQLHEKYGAKGKKVCFIFYLFFDFLGLEKAFDRVPREVICWAMRDLGVNEWLVPAVVTQEPWLGQFVVIVKFLPRYAMHKRGLCCGPVSVCLSVCHVRAFSPDG